MSLYDYMGRKSKYRKVAGEIQELMEQGWQLGEYVIKGKRNVFWMQRELFTIGEFYLCYAQSVRALLRKGLIQTTLRQPGDPTFLIRYERVRPIPDEGSNDPSVSESTK